MGYSFDDIYPLLQQNFGKRCCRKRVGYYNSLSVDFGDKTYHNRIKTMDNFYGEFRLIAYNRQWRVMYNGKMIMAATQKFASYDAADALLEQYDFGRLIGISQIEGIGIVIKLENGFSIEVKHTTDNEIIEFRLPDNKTLVLCAEQGWQLGQSDKPWPNHIEI